MTAARHISAFATPAPCPPTGDRLGQGRAPLAVKPADPDDVPVFSVTDEQASLIRRVFVEDGELLAMIELRRHFPGIGDNPAARDCARIIAGWKPPAKAPCAVSRPRMDRLR